jgi:hypothetical protein
MCKSENMRLRQRNTAETQCPYCHALLNRREASWVCPSCSTRHHVECSRAHGGCAVFSCPATRSLAPTTDPSTIDGSAVDRCRVRRPRRSAPGRGSSTVGAAIGFALVVLIGVVGFLVPGFGTAICGIAKVAELVMLAL